MEEIKQFLETAAENVSHQATEISRSLQANGSEVIGTIAESGIDVVVEGGIDFVIEAIGEVLGS